MSRKVKTGYPSIDKTHLKGIPKSKLNPTIFPFSMYETFMIINGTRLSEPAIQIGETIYTKRQLRNDVISIIRAMCDYSFKKDRKLVIITPNCYEGIVMTIAANAIGVRVLYLNPLDSDDELIRNIKTYNPSYLLVYRKDDNFAKKLYEANDASSLDVVVNIGDDVANKIEPFYFASAGKFFDFVPYISFKMTGDHSKQNVKGLILKNANNKNTSLYLQTSGSTSGKPKILPFTNENIVASMIYAANSCKLETTSSGVNKVMCILPYRLPYGWMTLFVNLIGGHFIILAPGATAQDIGTYYKYKPDFIYGTPTILRAFIDNTPEDADLSWLVAFYSAGFSVNESWYQECLDFLDKHGASKAEVRNNYGFGEGLCIGTASENMPHYSSSVGRFYVGPEWMLVDENLNEVKYGEIGEALVWSKSLCNGYFGEPDLTAEAFIKYKDKTFYRTGDYMSVDEDGIVTFHGRKSRFFQPLGATDKVNCETVEKAIIGCPIVENCAVIAKHEVKAADYGKAFIVLKDKDLDHDAAILQINKYLHSTLLDYQIPEIFSFLAEIPMMKSGKIDYGALEKM